MKYAEFRKTAAYYDKGTGLTVEPAAVDKSTRIREMLRRGRTDVSKWMHAEEKQAAFDPGVIGKYVKDNYGAVGGGALGLLAGALLGAKLGGRNHRGLGALLGGAIGAAGMGYSGNALQQSGVIEDAYGALSDAASKGYRKFRSALDKGTHATAEGLQGTGEAISELPGKIGIK